MNRERSDNSATPGFVSFAMSFSEGMLFTQENLIEPVIFYRKDGSICEPFLIQIPREVLGSCDIRERVAESVRQFVYEQHPDELVLVREGFFAGDGSDARCLSLIYSTPSGERTWVSTISHKTAGPWREILVKTGEFYQLYEKAVYRWN